MNNIQLFLSQLLTFLPILIYLAFVGHFVHKHLKESSTAKATRIIADMNKILFDKSTNDITKQALLMELRKELNNKDCINQYHVRTMIDIFINFFHKESFEK